MVNFHEVFPPCLIQTDVEMYTAEFKIEKINEKVREIEVVRFACPYMADMFPGPLWEVHLFLGLLHVPCPKAGLPLTVSLHSSSCAFRSDPPVSPWPGAPPLLLPSLLWILLDSSPAGCIKPAFAREVTWS